MGVDAWPGVGMRLGAASPWWCGHDDDDGDDDDDADDIYIMMKCMCVTKNHHFLLGVSCNHPGWFFMVLGRFLWFFMVLGQVL